MTEMGSTGGGEQPLRHVREGMTVVDPDGEQIGSVAEVRMSDPGAVTPESPDANEVGTALTDFWARENMPEQGRERLARLGYVRIDTRGLFSSDRFAASDEIARVVDDQVHLTIPADQLLS